MAEIRVTISDDDLRAFMEDNIRKMQNPAPASEQEIPESAFEAAMAAYHEHKGAIWVTVVRHVAKAAVREYQRVQESKACGGSSLQRSDASSGCSSQPSSSSCGSSSKSVAGETDAGEATDEVLARVYMETEGFAPALRAVYNLGRQRGAVVSVSRAEFERAIKRIKQGEYTGVCIGDLLRSAGIRVAT